MDNINSSERIKIKINQYLYLAPIVGALSLSVWVIPDHMEFRDIGITKFMELLTLLLFIALLTERALEVFVITWRKSDEDKLKHKIEVLENELNDLKKNSSNTEKAELDKTTEQTKLKEIEQAKLNKREYKSETQRMALWIALTLGILISAVGIQALQTLVDIGALGSLSKFQLTAFRLIDVLLTGGIIAGGSEGIHKLMRVYYSFTDASIRLAERQGENK